MTLALATIALFGHFAWSLSDGAARLWYASHARGCIYCRFVHMIGSLAAEGASHEIR